MDGNWASRVCCRKCEKPAPQRIANAARAAAKRGGGGGTKSKGDDLAEFKRELLAEVRNTIKGAGVAPSGPTSRRSSTVESDDSNGSEGQSTVATRERLGSEIQELRKLLGPDHVEVTKRCAELESLRQQRPLHTRILDGQRRLEKATKKVELRRKELAEEQMHMAHAKRDKPATSARPPKRRSCVRSRDRRSSATVPWSRPSTGGCWTDFGKCLDALDRLFHMASADEAGSAAKQLLEVAKNELAALECSLKSSGRDAGAGLDGSHGCCERARQRRHRGVDQRLGGRGRGGEPRGSPLEDRKAHRRVWLAAGTEEGQARQHRQVSWGREVLKQAGYCHRNQGRGGSEPWTWRAVRVGSICGAKHKGRTRDVGRCGPSATTLCRQCCEGVVLWISL